MRILLIEDDELLGEGIKSALSHFSYTVDWLRKGKHALPALSQNDFSLVILDLGLPDIDGITVLKNIRSQSIDAPVLILTARDQIDDKILGLDSGADDYMVKPFDVRELAARIKSLTRRSQGRCENEIHVGNACLNIDRRTLAYNDSTIEFTRREFPLINEFFEKPGKVFSREYLEALPYGWNEEIESNALEVHIHNLRKKIGSPAIKTVRGVGYVLIKEFFQ